MIEKVMNISFLEKSEDDTCNGFLHYFASPENLLVWLCSLSVVQGHKSAD